MTRARYIQAGDGRLVPADQFHAEARRVSYQVMPDISPYKSMIDGSIISSRSRHREHLRDHGCVEIGNDSSLFRKPQPLKSPPGLKETLIRVANEVLKEKRR